MDLVDEFFGVGRGGVLVPDLFVVGEVGLGWAVELVPRRGGGSLGLLFSVVVVVGVLVAAVGVLVVSLAA